MSVSKENIRSMLEGKLAPAQAESTIRCDVDITPSDMLQDLAQAYVRETERVLRHKGGFEDSPLSFDLWFNYLVTLIWMRVCWVRGNLPKDYSRLRKHVQIPSLGYVLLLQLGEAIDVEHGIRFLPKMEIVKDQLLSPQEVKEVSDRLFMYSTLGLSVESGIPQDTEGELGFMALSHMENTVKSYRPDHPVNGFLAGFVNMRKLEDVVGAERIRYGYMESYRLYIQELVVGRAGTSSG